VRGRLNLYLDVCMARAHMITTLTSCDTADTLRYITRKSQYWSRHLGFSYRDWVPGSVLGEKASESPRVSE
jgi:hypothetical protein